jgi:hypothetical protein
LIPLHTSNKELRNGWMLTKNCPYNNEPDLLALPNAGALKKTVLPPGGAGMLNGGARNSMKAAGT